MAFYISTAWYAAYFFKNILRSDTRHKSRLSHVNMKTAVEQEAGEKIDCKRL